MAFWDFFSTYTVALILASLPPRLHPPTPGAVTPARPEPAKTGSLPVGRASSSMNESIPTATANGSSSRVLSKIFSRMSSAARTRIDWSLQHAGLGQVHQSFHAIAGLRRNRHDLGELVHLAIGLNQRQQARLAHQVHLVDDEERRRAAFLEPVDHEPVAGARRFRRLDQEENQVHFREGVERGFDHPLIEPELGLVDARRVHEDQLGVGQVLDAKNPGSGRLGLVRDDGDLVAEDAVQERRLSHVRPAYQRDEPGAVGRGRPHGRSFGYPFSRVAGTNRKTVSPSRTMPSRSRARPSTVAPSCLTASMFFRRLAFSSSIALISSAIWLWVRFMSRYFMKPIVSKKNE